MPDVSVIILNHNYPHNILRLLDSLPITTGVDFETVVVDNGSEPLVKELLWEQHRFRRIDTLVDEPVNHWFSEGNNIGVRNSIASTKYILLLNNDTEILHPDWLSRMIEWMEGIPKTLLSYTWSDRAAYPSPGPRDVVSIGWSYLRNVPGNVRPEGWCCLIRRKFWRDISPDFPFHYGIEEMLGSIARDGGIIGCLSQYGRYITHYGQGSHVDVMSIVNRREPEPREWWKQGTPPEPLDFTLGPDEHRSYLEW